VTLPKFLLEELNQGKLASRKLMLSVTGQEQCCHCARQREEHEPPLPAEPAETLTEQEDCEPRQGVYSAEARKLDFKIEVAFDVH